FLHQIAEISRARSEIALAAALDPESLRRVKRMGFSDAQLAHLSGRTEDQVREERMMAGVEPVFKTVDTCAAEFEAYTPYYYSTYEEESEVRPGTKPKVMILGSGPNRIGQGIEFDYCCVHASFALRDSGYETIMVNCNPETVSTDYDTSDRLYFEPLTFEDVLAIVRAENPIGVIVQLGGQTPLKLADRLSAAGVTILGTQPDAIDLAEDRGRFGDVLKRLGLAHAPWGLAHSVEEAKEIADRIGYPVLVRPSYVLGGRGMEICYEPDTLAGFVRTATAISPDHPVFLDRFLEDAIEVDADALFDGHELYLGGVLEHIEEAGVHSGDSACVLPPHTLSKHQVREIRDAVSSIARALGVRGLINVQFAVKDGVLFVLEANPRASRTVPFVAKATGVQLAKAAARIMVGESISDLRATGVLPEGDALDADRLAHTAVKEAVLPFARFPGVDTLLGPEMKSTGEVMGIDRSFGVAFAKAEEAADARLPRAGTVFVSVRDRDKRAIILPVKRLASLGFRILATEGTGGSLQRNGVPVEIVPKVGEGSPHVGDLIAAGEIALVINTPSGSGPRRDGDYIRTAAVRYGIPSITTLSAVQAAVQGIEELLGADTTVKSLQEYTRL
ncbi:MAG: carbamoyl-phosphate synthase large subunit, partial [Actinomycetota bacterium]